MNRFPNIFLRVFIILGFVSFSCDSIESSRLPAPAATIALTASEVKTVVLQAIQEAQRLGKHVTIFVVSREGDSLGAFRMNNSPDSSFSALRKARTAAYLSSNGHAFTSLTACFITRDHFPPGIMNTPGGPLYGVGFSSLPGGDLQPNFGPLNDEPGGVPLYKNGILAGAVGVSGNGLEGFQKTTCSGMSSDEIIALGAVEGFRVPADKRGDNIFIDGIRFLYANSPDPAGNFSPSFNEAGSGDYIKTPVSGGGPKFPTQGGYVLNSKAGLILSQSDVEVIIHNAVTRAARTRAAIRRPLGAAAQVFISVVDTNGAILGIWRTPDATIFSFDVSAQKARTALAFSRTDNYYFGRRIRGILNTQAGRQIAMTTRAVGFLSQQFFPPGIDESTLGAQVEHGPLYEGPEFAYQKKLFYDSTFRINNILPAYGNGITIFPGGIPLYKDGRLAGAIGISGDGVDQDDYIAAAGSAGFEPPPDIRCDQFLYHGVRLPFVKFPRQPEL